ncbi:hypothetical protein JHK86_042899 [Glycine max]|nr:hypothetical protein JHK86_042899 [Glycine max]
MESSESLTVGSPQLLQGTPTYIVGDSTEINQKGAQKLATDLGVKWSLHAQEKIVFELLQQLRGNAARVLLEGVMKSTRQMFAEQEAVRSRLFIIQDVMQSSVQARGSMLGCKHTPHIGVTNHHSGVSGTAMKEPPATKKKTHVLKGETLPLLCVTLARRLPRQCIIRNQPTKDECTLVLRHNGRKMTL